MAQNREKEGKPERVSSGKKGSKQKQNQKKKQKQQKKAASSFRAVQIFKRRSPGVSFGCFQLLPQEKCRKKTNRWAKGGRLVLYFEDIHEGMIVWTFFDITKG